MQDEVGLEPLPRSDRLAEQQANGLVIADAVQILTTLSFIYLEAHPNDPKIAAVLDAIECVWNGSTFRIPELGLAPSASSGVALS